MARPKKGQEHPRSELANQVGLLTAIGTPQEQIARMLKMSKETLHKHYTDELELGGAKAGAVVGGKIFEAAKRGEQWACTLWAARRMGWSEKNIQEQIGPNGGPIQTETTVKADEVLENFLEDYARSKARSAKADGVADEGEA